MSRASGWEVDRRELALVHQPWPFPRVRQTILATISENSRRARDKHSALLDARLLAEVYHLTDRKASRLVFDLTSAAAADALTVLRRPAQRQADIMDTNSMPALDIINLNHTLSSGTDCQGRALTRGRPRQTQRGVGASLA